MFVVDYHFLEGSGGRGDQLMETRVPDGQTWASTSRSQNEVLNQSKTVASVIMTGASLHSHNG